MQGFGVILRPVVLLLAVSTLAHPAHAAERMGRKVRNDRFGYSIRILETFSQVPTPPKNQRLAGRFVGERTYFGTSGLEVRRYPEPQRKKVEKKDGKGKYGDPDKGDDPDKTDKKDKKEEPKRIDPWEADTFFASLKTLTVLRGWKGLKVGSGKNLKIGKQIARLYEFHLGSTSYAACSIPAPDGGEFGLLYWAPKKTYQKDFRGPFRASMRSFSFEDVAEVSAAALELLSPKERTRRAKKRSIEGIPGWYSLDTDNYVILSNSENRDLVKFIGRSIERVRDDVYIDLFPPVGEITALCVVRVCATQNEYFRYGGRPGTAGYWNSREEELVFYDRFPNMSKRKSVRNSLSVLYHEAFHQYIFYAFGELSPHSWFNEGHGDYFAGADFSGSRVRIKPFEWRTLRVKQSAREDKLVPLEKFVRYTQREYYKNGGANYAQGWAFIYFLRSVTRNERYRQILPIYFNTLKAEIEKIDSGVVTTTPPVPRPDEPGEEKPDGEKPDGEKPGDTGKKPGDGGDSGPGKSTGPEDDPEDPEPGDPAGPDPEKPEPDSGEPDPGKGEPRPGEKGEEGEEDEDLEKAGEVAPPSEKKKRDPKLVKAALKRAVDAAFDGVDMERLDLEFRRFILKGL